MFILYIAKWCAIYVIALRNGENKQKEAEFGPFFKELIIYSQITDILIQLPVLKRMRQNLIGYSNDSGCGTVGRVIASDNRDQRVESG